MFSLGSLGSPLSTVSSRSEIPPSSQPVTSRLAEPSFWVEPPRLTESQKALYRPTSEAPPHNYSIPLDEVVGQFPERGAVHFYFGRLEGGPCHRFLATDLTRDHPDLIDLFKRAKREGNLPIPNFDPSQEYVHHLSRLVNRVDLKNRRASVSSAYSGASVPTTPSAGVEPDSNEDVDDHEESSEDGDDEYGSDEDEGLNVRRSTRNVPKHARAVALPFSPKKTRSQKVAVITDDDDDEEEDDEDESGLLRRSGRNKTIRVRLTRIADSDEESYVDSESGSGRVKGKAATRKVVPAAYGRIRPVEDIDFDDQDDPDTAALRNHRKICEKCGDKPAHELSQALEKKKKKGKKNNGGRKKTGEDADLQESEGERVNNLGGWVRCLKCPVASHWKCCPQRDIILKAVLEKDLQVWRDSLPETDFVDSEGNPKVPSGEPKKRKFLEQNETTEFICAACNKDSYCIGCEESISFQPEALDRKDSSGDIEMGDTTQPEMLLFRCFTCKRPGHYGCLPMPDDDEQVEVSAVAEHYQGAWLCGDCSSFVYPLDKIIAWRPSPPHAIEKPWPADDKNHWKTALPREYLVKWDERSFLRTEWVPHMWLVSTNQAKLRNYVMTGGSIELIEEDLPENEVEASHRQAATTRSITAGNIPPIVNAQERIPPGWKTIDRILDVLLWKPASLVGNRKSKKGHSPEDNDEEHELIGPARAAAYGGEQPPEDLTWEAAAFKKRFGRALDYEKEAGLVAWAFIKWNDLGYEDTTWDSPPRPDDPAYPAFQNALKRYIAADAVRITKRTQGEQRTFDNRPETEYQRKHVLKDAAHLELGQEAKYKLMDFQVDGFNWLCNNWWTQQPCILADEMGLGKTVQIASFIGNVIKNFGASPALVIVPNVTIGNWVREFERWAPELNVVPFYGEARARDVIKRYELNHTTPPKGFTSSRFHVLIATYESVIGAKDFTPIFKNQPRWELMVIDEGQRLKSDSSLLFKKLNELTTGHRTIMTGTPLNNNIRELFNLMNFLDPGEWNDLQALEREYEVLSDDLVKTLHGRLRPYFLRRLKSEVIKLPPKNEIIVPVSMTPLQRELYKAIVANNANLFNGVVQNNSKAGTPQVRGKITNLLMEMRKVVQHPYLHDDKIEDRSLGPVEVHNKMVAASAKLRFLKLLLPKLKDRGHRVLLFSQFKIALNIIEDFLVGEGFRYLRLDGDVTGPKRQRGMDAFNKPGSDVFIYLLTTRAGGVGINLFTADTVIIFDPDFNPHQDLQAIARAHRFGQQKTCMVFKLIVKDSAEESIIQKAKSKLVLDHVIVQKMDDDDEAGGDFQSILTHGAKNLFADDHEARDIIYTDNDVLNLIEKTESMPPEESTDNKQAGELSFSFAKIWTADNDTLQEVQDEEQVDSWADTLVKINKEREVLQAAEAAQLGRGVRRAAAKVAEKTFKYDEASPDKRRKSKQPDGSQSDISMYGGSVGGSQPGDDSDGDISMHSVEAPPGDLPPPLKKPHSRKSSVLSEVPRITGYPAAGCGICSNIHPPGTCPMLNDTDHLVEYREMLLFEPPPGHDPMETMRAIQQIDEELAETGAVHLIEGQPLHPVMNLASGPSVPQAPRAQVPNPPQHSNAASSSSSKRPSSSHLIERPTKKPRPTAECVVCNASPTHPLEVCPIVLKGPESINEVIHDMRDSRPGNWTETINALKRLKTQKKDLVKTGP